MSDNCDAPELVVQGQSLWWWRGFLIGYRNHQYHMGRPTHHSFGIHHQEYADGYLAGWDVADVISRYPEPALDPPLEL